MLTATRFYIRPMTEGDISQVAEIEGESFPTTWPRTAYKRELSNRLARYLVLIDGAHPAVEPPTRKPRRFGFAAFFRPRDEVEPTSDCVVGYVGVWLMVDEAHIVAIAVREPYRRKGLGERLLIDAIDLALSNKQESVTLEVRRSNTGAQALYEKYRFLKVGERKRYYSDNHEDAIVMSTPPIQHENFKEHLAYLRDLLEKRWQSTE